MAPRQLNEDDDNYPSRSIGQPESMRNEEQRLRDNQGGSELTDLPDDHPVGAAGETASAEAEGPPPDRERRIAPGDNADIGAPVRSAGPAESTLPEESPLGRAGEAGGRGGDENENEASSETVVEASRLQERLRNTRVGPGGEIVPEEERGE